MVYYKVKCNYCVADGIEETKLKRFWNRAERDYLGGNSYKLFIFYRDETTFSAVLMFSVKVYTLSTIKKQVINEFDETGEIIQSISFLKSPKEITASETISLLRVRSFEEVGGTVHRCSKRVLMRWCSAFYMNDDTDLKFDEYVLSHVQLSFPKAKDEARDILADDSLYEELERIYSPLNKRKPELFTPSPGNRPNTGKILKK